MSQGHDLPHYEEASFAAPTLECDAIMKGGITSGIVYPYAILEIATQYRFRALGGTSAGAIAAAFAAAAEYSRSARQDPSGFVRLQHYCDQLPDILLSLFQPDREFRPLMRIAKLLARVGKRSAVAFVVLAAIILVIAGAVAGQAALAGIEPRWVPRAFGALVAFTVAIGSCVGVVLYAALTAKNRLLSDGFGACSGLTVKGSKQLALTDWLHAALQDIAFGSSTHPTPLTFGNLEKPTNGAAPIFLRMVTTNLSMGRPHTLPQLGLQAGFRPTDWQALFPAAVLTHLNAKSGPWNGIKGAKRFPAGEDLPVICAVRMSLSFPLLFKAVPILTFDHEFRSVVKALGGTPKRRLCTAWLTDGGLSSNFPIHLFDSPLPSRPTFAISLDSLQVSPDEVTRRVLLPETSLQGSGVQVTEINSLTDFGWRLMASAKDWQDQLASEITGQRERIARIFLDHKEGGLNLAMPPDLSRALMGYGRDAGRLFTTRFDFDEHRWRRMLGVYRNTEDWLDRAASTWAAGFDTWFKGYRTKVRSYQKITQSDRQLIGKHFTEIARAAAGRQVIKRADDKFPAKTGQLRVTGRY